MAELRILNSLLHDVFVVDIIYSMVWSERHGEAGELELKVPLEYSLSPHVAVNNYISKNDTEQVMIIEDISPLFDEEFGDSLVIKGHTCDILLDRRVPLDIFNINGSVQSACLSLIEDNIVNPANSKRVIQAFTYMINPDVTITAVDQFTSGTLYEIISSVAATNGLGFKVSLVDFSLVFSFYKPKDRSSEQFTNPPVIFSREFDNVLNSKYEYITNGSKNATLVIVEDEIPSLQRTMVFVGSEPEGLDRRETYSEQSITRTVSGEDDLTDGEVSTVIFYKGVEQLADLQPILVFDGQFVTDVQFVFGTDFFLGDLVQCVIQGHDVPARAVEYVHSIEGDGEAKYVSFDFVL